MYTNTKIDTENAKPIRAPFDTEYWISDGYYNVTTEATLIYFPTDWNGNSAESQYRKNYVNTEIPGECYVYYSAHRGKFISWQDLLKIAQRRGYPLTYGYDESAYDTQTSIRVKTIKTAFDKWQYYYLSGTETESVTIPIEKVTSNSSNSALVLALREWSDDTEFTITIDDRTYSYKGADIKHNNIIINLYGIVSQDTTATLTWIERGGAKIACFSQSHTLYINSNNLITATVNLRSNLEINASTLPTSQINVDIIADKDTYSIFNIPLIRTLNMYYISGYNSDLPTLTDTSGNPNIGINTNYPVMARRFEINDNPTFEKNVITIEAVDSINNLYSKSMEGLIYYNGNLSFFNDFVGINASDTSSSEDFVNLCRMRTGPYISTNYDVDEDNHGTNTISRYQFIFWLMFYAYAMSFWEIDKDYITRIAEDFKEDFKGVFYAYEGIYNIPSYFEYADSTLYNDDSTDTADSGWNKDRPYLAVIDDIAPQPLMAWIMDTWHGHTTIKDRTGTDREKYFRPMFVDAGRPTFSINKTDAVIQIDEADICDLSEMIDKQNKYLIIPKNTAKALYDTKEGPTNPIVTYADDGDELLMYTKPGDSSTGLQEVAVYNYNGGFHYYLTATREKAYGQNNNQVGTIRMLVTSPDLTYKKMETRWDNPETYNWYDADAQQYVTVTVNLSDDTEWTLKGYPLYIDRKQSQLTNSNINNGETVTIEYENTMGPIIDNTLIKESVLYRSNKTGTFTWRGDPRLQPRDVFYFNRFGNNLVTCTIESIETKHENGGTTQTITYREGIV